MEAITQGLNVSLLSSVWFPFNMTYLCLVLDLSQSSTRHDERWSDGRNNRGWNPIAHLAYTAQRDLTPTRRWN